MNRRAALAVLVALAGLLAAPSSARAAVDDFTSARELYAAAEYEDALTLLNRLRTAPGRPEEARAIDQYRAFCLLALGRSADAEQAIAAVILAEPNFKPSVDLSPRVRTAFNDVRRRMLPQIVQEKYAAAKMAYDQKNYVAAATGFKLVLDSLKDPELAAMANQAPLSDLKTLSTGFYDLAAAASAPPPAPPAPAPAPGPTASSAPAKAQAQTDSPDARYYSADDSNVVPPIMISQYLPPFPANITVAQPGVLEVLIDERGLVVSVSMRVPVSPRYDRAAVDAARGWRYRPALLDGTPVRYRKVVQISIKR
jgi:tetratricopeptide (TPR) repeat protein